MPLFQGEICYIRVQEPLCGEFRPTLRHCTRPVTSLGDKGYVCVCVLGQAEGLLCCLLREPEARVWLVREVESPAGCAARLPLVRWSATQNSVPWPGTTRFRLLCPHPPPLSYSNWSLVLPLFCHLLSLLNHYHSGRLSPALHFYFDFFHYSWFTVFCQFSTAQ